MSININIVHQSIDSIDPSPEGNTNLFFRTVIFMVSVILVFAWVYY